MADRLIVVFARAPEEERRHKPLRARAGGRQIELLHRLLVDRALKAAAAVDADVRLVTTGDLERARTFALRRVAPERLQLAAQSAGGLRERLQAAMGAAFADGYRQVVLIGGDTPELSGAAVADAFARLAPDGSNAVLGPAPDGGYYLLGLTAPIASAFDVPLSTGRAAAATEAALAAAGLTVSRLSPLGDVDTAADALALSRRLRRAAGAEDLLLRLALLDVLSGDVRPLSPDATPHALRATSVTGARAPPYLRLTRVQ